MAKGLKPREMSRIRFVMVDAEIAEGDIASVTQAIQNALRGPAPIALQRLPSPSKTSPQDIDGAAVSEPELETEAEEAVVSPEVPRQRSQRRAAPTPRVIEIDMTTEPTLQSYALRTNPKSNHKRYLTIAAWLHEHRKIDTITADHVYTCYRHVGWPASIPDFAQPLRELKHKQFFTSPETGKYSINHLGLSQAAKNGAGGD
jgi:hypothetical protein